MEAKGPKLKILRPGLKQIAASERCQAKGTKLNTQAEDPQLGRLAKEPKQAYIYGQLDLGATQLTRGYGWVWSVSGWLLTPFMKRAGPERVAKMRERVTNEIDTTFLSHYASRSSLRDAMTVEAVRRYGARKTGQKTLLTMDDLAP